MLLFQKTDVIFCLARGKLSHYTLPPESDAPIAEPTMPAAIAFDSTDLPLEELDDAVFASEFSLHFSLRVFVADILTWCC